MAERAKFRAEDDTPLQAGLRELRRNTAGAAPALSNIAGIPGRGIRQLVDYTIAQPAAALAADLTDETPVVRQSNPYGFPASSVQEMERVRRLLNPEGSGAVTETVAPKVAEAVTSIPAGIRRVQAAEPPPVANPAPAMQTSDRGIGEGFRIVRPAVGSPVLTNVADPMFEAARGENYIQTETGRTDFFGGVPARIPQAATPTASASASAAEPTAGGFRPAKAGQRVFIPAYNEMYGSVAEQRQAATNAQNAETSQATAGIAGIKAQAELAKLNKELGSNLDPVFEEVPIDPEQPLLGTIKTITGFASKGGDNPVYIPREALEEHRANVAQAPTEEARRQLEAQFRQTFFGG
jgi:hypothetical protein